MTKEEFTIVSKMLSDLEAQISQIFEIRTKELHTIYNPEENVSDCCAAPITQDKAFCSSCGEHI